MPQTDPIPDETQDSSNLRPPFARYLSVCFGAVPLVISVLWVRNAMYGRMCDCENCCGVDDFLSFFGSAILFGSLIWVPVLLLVLWPGFLLFGYLARVLKGFGLSNERVIMTFCAAVVASASIAVGLLPLGYANGFRGFSSVAASSAASAVPIAVILGFLFLRPVNHGV